MTALAPEYVWLTDVHLAGIRTETSLSTEGQKTVALWRELGPLRAQVRPEPLFLYSVTAFPDGFFESYQPDLPYEKWAAFPWPSHEDLPLGLARCEVPAGHYAVFTYQGTAAGAGAFLAEVYGKWLPASGRKLEHRPHLARMAADYRPDNPDAVEYFYVPVAPEV